jgi:hypothetical protein
LKTHLCFCFLFNLKHFFVWVELVSFLHLFHISFITTFCLLKMFFFEMNKLFLKLKFSFEGGTSLLKDFSLFCMFHSLFLINKKLWKLLCKISNGLFSIIFHQFNRQR